MNHILTKAQINRTNQMKQCKTFEEKQQMLNYIINNIFQTYFDLSSIHGIGLFAQSDLKKDINLCFFDGQYMHYDFYKKHINGEDNINLEWNAVTKDLLLVRFFKTKYGFINHSREPNLQIFKNPLRLITIKNIKADEELLLDYRQEDLPDDYLKNHGNSYL